MRNWIKLIAGLAVIALMIWFLVRIGSFALRVAGTTDGGAEPDPMFAEEMEIPTRPPELNGDQDDTVYQDNSANWVIDVQTPVEMTVEELIREAEQQAGNS